MMKKKHLFWNWMPMLAWMAAIFLISHQPSAELPDLGLLDLLFKKGAHFGAYAVLAILTMRVLGVEKRPFLFALIITILYAASDEFHQTFVPGRNGSTWDVLLDSTGAIAGLIALRWWFSRKLQPPAMLTSDQP
ncbi:MAG: VanZ family protein [Chloroflexi bacterium]|nr:VanZ family protein [Chloroflexota bacterium]